MKNTYLTGYLPFVAILLFGLSLSLYTQGLVLGLFKKVGLYNSMLEVFTETEMKLTIVAALMLLFFMIFATLKVIANTINELSLLFFSKDTEGDLLKKVRSGSIVFFAGGLLSLISFSSAVGIITIFLLTTIGYFIYFVFKISPDLTTANIVGIIAFQVVFWAALGTLLALFVMKIYNGALSSMPI
ncbi:small-conductance mechanosensitive channel [Bacillus ectoiniformans]|uniref:DUF5366 family protein n=1 Tax=Bacillus ectoiniformans TaxID=1494429 RepID=UPI00195AFA00|nr:DUF5366 family protein [Bacillus ectoiniformans]MBM7648507.1 small-conductance mechanosensitive channel [Bacillus ectoiniformans]